MNGDEAARLFDMMLAEFLEAAAHRKSLGLPLPGRGRKGASEDALPPWFASKEGRTRVKTILAAMKQERKTLKALARFSRKGVKAKAKPKPEAAAEIVAPTPVVAKATADVDGSTHKSADGAGRPRKAVARSTRGPSSPAPSKPTKPVVGSPASPFRPARKRQGKGES